MEKQRTEKKHRCKADFIDVEARNTFQVNKVITSIIKCAHGCNHYGLRDALINNNVVEANCPQCDQLETSDHVIRHSHTIKMRREFIKELATELVKKKPEGANVEMIISFAEDIMHCFEQEENEDKYETNQHFIGMKELFRGHMVVDWERVQINSAKHRALNKIVVKKCVEYYMKC